MNKKQRIISLTIGIGLGVVGFTCLGVAAMVQNKLGDTYENTIFISGFAFMILASIYLIVKAPKIILSELEEQAESMESENIFFTTIKFEESINSLKEKFLKAGFIQGENYLHKKIFSLTKDYINYYVVIVDNTNMTEYMDVFFNNIDTLIESQKRLNKNNYIYLIFFKNNISDNELIPLKFLVINQDVIQGLNYQADTVVPIVYNIGKQEYILRINNRKLSLKPIDIAIKNFCKVVFRG